MSCATAAIFAARRFERRFNYKLSESKFAQTVFVFFFVFYTSNDYDVKLVVNELHGGASR